MIVIFFILCEYLDNNILIVGDNRSKETLKSKLILINNIDLDKNTFDISYIESLSTERIFIYLFTANLDIDSYNYGINIGVGSSTSKNTIYTEYELLTNYLYPPSLSIDNGKISLKLINNNEIYDDTYIHLDVDFDLVGKDNTSLKLESTSNIKKNKDAYIIYFHEQIKKYQEFYKNKLKILEDERLKKEQDAILAEKNRILLLKKYAIIIISVTLLIIIIGIYVYRTSKSDKDKDNKNNKNNGKKSSKWTKKKDIISVTKSSK